MKINKMGQTALALCAGAFLLGSTASANTTGWQKTKDGYTYYESHGQIMHGRQYRQLPKVNPDKQV